MTPRPTNLEVNFFLKYTKNELKEQYVDYLFNNNIMLVLC